MRKLHAFGFLIFILVTLQTQPAFSSECNDLFATEKEVRKMTIWRYGSQKDDFDTATHTSWVKQEAGSYRLDLLGTATSGHYYFSGSSFYEAITNTYFGFINPPENEARTHINQMTLLDMNQSFSLEKQTKGKIDQQVIDQQVQIAKNLKSTQITFFENSVNRKISKLKEEFDEVPTNARKAAKENSWADYQSYFAESEELVNKHDPTYELKQAAAWVISGQDPYDSQLKMPFEHANMSEQYNRNDFPFAWEIGRAASNTLTGLKEILNAITYFILKELVILDGNVADSYIFVHSPTPMHTKLYKNHYKMKEYSKTNKQGEVILLASLQTLIDLNLSIYFSNHLNKIKDIWPELNYQQLVWVEYKMTSNSSYFLESKNRSKVVVRDFSELSYHRISRQIHKLSTTSKKKKISPSNILLNLSPYSNYSDSVHIREKNAQRTFSHHNENYDPMPLREFLFQNKSIEIEVLGLSEGESSLAVIQGALKKIIFDLKNEGFSDPYELLRSLKIKIAISSSHLNLIHNLMSAHSGYEMWYFQTFDQHFTFSGGLFDFPRPPVRGKTYASALFEIDDLLPKNFKTIHLELGETHQFQHLYMPELYSSDNIN